MLKMKKVCEMKLHAFFQNALSDNERMRDRLLCEIKKAKDRTLTFEKSYIFSMLINASLGMETEPI